MLHSLKRIDYSKIHPFLILLQSIEEIEPHQVFNTGCKPLLVHCNDLEFYVCKYNTGHASAEKLLREYIAAAFLRTWNLLVPAFNLVRLKQEHLPPSLGVSIVNFECPCFGSLFNRNFKEVDVFLSEMSVSQRRRFTSPEEFLAIAFFDLWISNEDRHSGNYNLLLSANEEDWHFVPIDHESCFHTGNQQRENYTLSWEESLLSSALLTKLFKISTLTDQTFLAGLRSNWYLCSQSCKSLLPALLNNTPDKWLINKEKFHEDVVSFMFSEKWFEECWQTFLGHMQVTINHSNYGSLL